MADHVPTNGFSGAPAPAPAAAPQVPDQHQQGFSVPPAGSPPRMPAAPNGTPVGLANQQPGWVQNPGQPQAAPQPAPQAPAQQPQDMNSLVAMLQAALGGKPIEGQPAPAQAPAQAPLQGSVKDFDVNSIDDPIIKSMAEVMKSAGKDLDLDRVLGNALAHGDPNLVDAAYLREAGGANAANLLTIAQGIVKAVAEKADRVTREVHAQVGGEAQWGQAVAAFNQAAPQELRVVVAQMLNSTDEKLIKAGAKLVAGFSQTSGLVPQQGAPLLNTIPAAMQAQALSKEQFKAELAKLKPDTPGYEDAYQALALRRTAGRRAGY